MMSDQKLHLQLDTRSQETLRRHKSEGVTYTECVRRALLLLELLEGYRDCKINAVTPEGETFRLVLP